MSDSTFGVFLCDCGSNIAPLLDLDELQAQVRCLPGVALVKRLPYSCSTDGLATILSDAARLHLDRVVVAGCTPRTLSRRFREAAAGAGLAANFFELVDIREGCAWVHSEDRQGANRKALDLVRMGLARAAAPNVPQPASAAITPGAVVIGGGIAGLTAALTLAFAGQKVHLVEKSPHLGGQLLQANTLYPDRRSAAPLLTAKIEAVTANPLITVHTSSVVTSLGGTVGSYSVELNGGAVQFDAGAVIVATGATPLVPRGLFKYDGSRVVTQAEFELELQQHVSVSNLVMLLCAGQRNQAVPYCSGFCCMTALKQAMEARALNPDAAVTILFRDLYLLDEPTYEARLLEARKVGVRFVQYAPAAPPSIASEAVLVRDASNGESHRLACDRLVLATPLVPQTDASVLAHTLGISLDVNGFFPEVRHRLRPESVPERGIYVCGAAHHPTGWTRVEFQATTTAFKALRHLRSSLASNQAPVASVDDRLCTGCGTCVEHCPVNAITMHKREGALDLSEIDPLRCVGCGNCVVACPVRAISQPLDSDAQMLAQIEAALAHCAPPRILVLGCEWSGHAAAELAGARRMAYPANVRMIRTRCSARFDPTHVLWAMFSGADGVFLGACPPGECHYIDGNRFARDRFDALSSLLDKVGFDPRRLRLDYITPDDPHDFVRKITDFATLIRALGPSPASGER